MRTLLSNRGKASGCQAPHDGIESVVKIDQSTIVVTGGAGFIGSATVELLLQAYHPRKLVVIDNLLRGRGSNLAALRDSRVTVVESDIRDRGAVGDAMQGADAVIHLAALRITMCAAEPREAFDVMCAGSYNVVEAAQHAGVQKIVAASSASVYGMADHFPTTEDHHPYNDRTWYGVSKTMLEGLLRSFNETYGLPYLALRYFNVYGPRMDIYGKYTEVLIRWMERLENGEPPLILGDGNQTMDFVYVGDVARANVLALASDASDEVANIGSGAETSLNDLARLLARVMERDVAPVYGPARSVNAVSRRLASTAKAQHLLGFEATVPLEEGLRRLVTWWRGERVGA
jgi:UDP-glucose 4-epimerase